MQKISAFAAAVAAGLAATSGAAFAGLNFVPEPGSIGLSVAALAGAIYFARKGKK